MLDFLDNPILQTVLYGALTLIFFIFGFGDMPPKVNQKTGKPRTFSDRWKHTSRDGKVYIALTPLLVLITILSFYMIFE